MLLSAVSVLVVAHLSSEIPEGLMNNPVLSRREREIGSHNAYRQSNKESTSRPQEESSVSQFVHSVTFSV